MNIKKVVFLSAAIAFIFSACTKKESGQKAVNQNLDEATKRHIPLFSKLDPSTITESGSITETYHIYESPKEMKVKTDDGSSLNYRAQPVTGEKLGKFSYGDTVYVSQRTHDASTIDGITDYWYYALSYADIEPYGGWVFGGYLSEPEESSTSSNLFEELLGEWDSASYMLKLEGNGDFALGRKESGWIGGNWTLENKTIKVTNAQVYDEEPESFEMKVISVSENELTVSLGDSNLDFTRIFQDEL